MGEYKNGGHHLVDLYANGAAQLGFDFQWTDRDGALLSLCAVYVQLQALSGLSGLTEYQQAKGLCSQSGKKNK